MSFGKGRDDDNNGDDDGGGSTQKNKKGKKSYMAKRRKGYPFSWERKLQIHRCVVKQEEV